METREKGQETTGGEAGAQVARVVHCTPDEKAPGNIHLTVISAQHPSRVNRLNGPTVLLTRR